MNQITGIQAVSFDGDGTLWDFEKVMRQSLYHVLQDLEQVDPKAAAMLDTYKMIEIRNRVAKELKGKVVNLEAVRLEAFQRTLKEIGRPNDSLASRLNTVYLKHRFEDIELFEDVLSTLEALQGKYTIGLLSNGNNYPDRCGLEGVFQFAVFSQDYGVEKPDPKLFQIAMEKASCSKEQLFHIGDSLTDDIVGGMNTGIKCAWLNRNNAENYLGIKVDYEIHKLSDLLNIL